ncbi:hypothetical protein BV25DRAFT_1821227 [Artomyces pyxidatus]|uniref:Uncharacterized protein n=1 Tax=Artomyces pyxidatus TaxID=48021 RepID=A0ACB8TBZ3_9AGAM|nr:hypothetical protein BV25DRAFT_1821227 [Artomyces pyxidatus]
MSLAAVEAWIDNDLSGSFFRRKSAPSGIQSLFRRKDVRGSHASPPLGLSDKTNAPLPQDASVASTSSTKGKASHAPRIVLGGLSKSSPTVALTNAIASRTSPHLPHISDLSPSDAHVRNHIPFPSSVEDEPILPLCDEDDTLPIEPLPTSSCLVENQLKRPLPVETKRRRCQTPLSPSSHGAAPRRRTTNPSSARVRSLIALTVGTPSAKRPKRSKRAIADLQFTETVHRSITSHLKQSTRMITAEEDVAMEIADERDRAEALRDQDRRLAGRLMKHLLDAGHAPARLDGCAGMGSAIVSPLTEFELCPEADIVMDVDISVLEPIDSSPPLPTQTILAKHVHRLPPVPTSLPPPPPSLAPSLNGPILAIRPPPSRVAVPSAPPTPPALPDSRVYTMSQLVATLILRHGDRTSEKPKNRDRHATSSVPTRSKLFVSSVPAEHS